MKLARGALALLALALPAPAFAQAHVPPGPVLSPTGSTTEWSDRPGRYHLGPLWLTPTLALENAGVDTNVFNSAVDRVPDTAIVFAPRLSGVLPLFDRVRLLGEGRVGFNYYQRKGSESSVDFSGSGRAELRLGRFLLYGGGGGGQGKQRFSVDLDERVMHHRKFALAGLRARVTSTLSLSLQGRGDVWEFASSRVSQQNIKASLDRNTLTGSAQLGWAVTRKTTMVALGEAIEDRFLFREPGDQRPPRVRSFRYLGGFELSPRAFVRGRVMGGWREIPAQYGAPRYGGVAAFVDASMPVLGFGRLYGEVNRDLFWGVAWERLSEARLRNSFVSTGGTVRLHTELPLRLMLLTSYSYADERYLVPFLAGGGSPTFRRDHYYSATSSLLRQITRGLSLGVTATWTRRVSTLPYLSFEGFRYGLSGALNP